MTIHEWLKENGACREARDWAAHKTFLEIYATCPHVSWLLWLFMHTNRHEGELWRKANQAFAKSYHNQQNTYQDHCNAVRSVLKFEAFNTPWEDA